MAWFTLFFPLLFSLNKILMFVEFKSTRAFPCWIELFTNTALTVSFIDLMNLVRMFTITFEILRTINWNISIISTCTSSLFTFNLIIFCLQKIVILEIMITKAFSGWSYNFAFQAIRVDPTWIDSIGCKFAIILFVLLKLFLIHQFSTIISNQIAIL